MVNEMAASGYIGFQNREHAGASLECLQQNGQISVDAIAASRARKRYNRPAARTGWLSGKQGGQRMKFVGLTDDPAKRKVEHNNPSDWTQRSFSTEEEARKWAKELLDTPDYETGPGDLGWRFGYTYKIRPWTHE
jgi:hypothetical protein